MTPPKQHKIYAVKHKNDEECISFGLSAPEAWTSAIKNTGYLKRELQDMGYMLVEGLWEWIPELLQKHDN